MRIQLDEQPLETHEPDLHQEEVNTIRAKVERNISEGAAYMASRPEMRPEMRPEIRADTRRSAEPPSSSAFRGILSGRERPSYGGYEEPPPLRPTLSNEADYDDLLHHSQRRPDAYARGFENDWTSRPTPRALMSNQPAQSAQMSFDRLAESLLARAGGDRTIEDITRELLRGYLRQWLDDNLPPLVERLVREEIERVARRGR
jgi:cell pole-organizing protein PopZ